MAALATLLVLVAIAGSTDLSPYRGYAQFTAFAMGCHIDGQRRSGVVGCVRAGHNLYRLIFTRSLDRATPVASLSTCCTGSIGASVVSTHEVLVVFRGRARYPLVANVFVP